MGIIGDRPRLFSYSGAPWHVTDDRMRNTEPQPKIRGLSPIIRFRQANDRHISYIGVLVLDISYGPRLN